MTSLSRNARVAGLLYLTLMTAPLRLIYIQDKLIVSGNAVATANNIAAHQTLFRLGILSDLFTATMAIFLTLALYRLFKAVDQGLAVIMVILGALMVTPIYFLNTINDAAALLLVRGADFLAAFDKPQREALAMLFLRLHNHGVVVNEVRSEEHTSELQSRPHLVCRLLLEKKKKKSYRVPVATKKKKCHTKQSNIRI